MIKRFLNRHRWKKCRGFKKGTNEVWIKFAVKDGVEGYLVNEPKSNKGSLFRPHQDFSSHFDPLSEAAKRHALNGFKVTG